MPIAEAQGREFNFPEGTTPEQMGIAIDEFFAGQDQQPVQAAPQQISAPDQAKPEEGGFLQGVSDIFTGGERVTPATERLPELGQGGLLSGEDPAKGAAIAPVILSTTDPREIGQILTNTFPKVIGVTEDPEGNLFATNNKTGVTVVLNKPGLSQLDIVQGLGLAAAFTPAGRVAAIPAIAGRGVATGLGRVGAVGAASAATETGLQAAQQGVGGEAISTEEVALAGLLGGAGQVLGEGISAAARAVRGRIAPETKELVKQAEEAGVSLRTTDVLPPDTAAGNFLQRYREQLPFLEGKALASQQDQRIKAVGEFLENIGATETGHEKIILESLRGSKAALGKKASKQFTEADEILNAFGDVARPKTDEVIDSAIEQVKELGTLADPALITKLQAIKDAPQGNFGLTRRIRSEVGSLISDFFSGKNTQIGKSGVDKLQVVKRAIDEDLEEFAKATRNAKAISKFRQANKTFARQAKLFRESQLKNVLDKADVTPEIITDMLKSNRISKGKLLFNTLGREGKESARASIIQQAIKKAGGIDDINPNRFITELNRLEAQTGAFLKPDQKRQMEGLKKVLEATKRSQDFLAPSVVPTGATTAPLISGLALGAGAINNLGLTLVTGGTGIALSKAFESKPVRTALLRLANTKPGSTAEDKALREIMPLFLSGSQAARTEAQ